MPEWIGKIIGNVRIEKFLARGGMAEVYLGTHLMLARPVAVKVLHSFIEEEPIPLQRFEREARVVAAMRHPNIVQIHDFGRIDGHHYIVMEYIKGPALATYLRPLHQHKQRIPHQQVAHLLDGLADALDYAHGQGVIHRDIKPGNILLHSKTNAIPLDQTLPKDVEAVLTDFGLVRLVDADTHTTSDMISGTPTYMSPEQARGVKIDHRSDIYSLGIVLYELLAGHVPFKGDYATVLQMQIHALPPPIPELPAGVQAVLDCALQKNPEDRYQTSHELALDFSRSIGLIAEPVKIREPEPAPLVPARFPIEKHAPLPRQASRTIIIALLAVMGALLGVTGAFLIGLWNSPLAEQWFALTQTPTEPAATQTPIESTATHTVLPTQTALPERVLLDDDFSVAEWGTLTDALSSVEYEGETLRMRLFTRSYVIWSTPNDREYENVHLEVTAFTNNTDRTTAFGFICAQQLNDWSFYYLAITPDGEYAIIKATEGKSDKVLTPKDAPKSKWESSDLIAVQASSYRIGADCGNGKLTLYVDGKQIASASDTTYRSGQMGLFVWSGEGANSADMTFDNFLIKSLE